MVWWTWVDQFTGTHVYLASHKKLIKDCGCCGWWYYQETKCDHLLGQIWIHYPYFSYVINDMELWYELIGTNCWSSKWFETMWCSCDIIIINHMKIPFAQNLRFGCFRCHISYFIFVSKQPGSHLNKDVILTFLYNMNPMASKMVFILKHDPVSVLSDIVYLLPQKWTCA